MRALRGLKTGRPLGTVRAAFLWLICLASVLSAIGNTDCLLDLWQFFCRPSGPPEGME